MDVAYGPWYGALVRSSSVPLLMQRLVMALGVPGSGKGLNVVLDLALRAVAAVAEGSPLLDDWKKGFAELAKQCTSLQVEHATLRELGRTDAEVNRAYASLVRIARRGALMSSSALKALGCELLCAAGSGRVADGLTLELIAALANSERSLQMGSDWLPLESLRPFSHEGLKDALKEGRFSGQAQVLARRLERLLEALTRPAMLPIEGQGPAQKTLGPGTGELGSKPKQPKNAKTHKPRDPAAPPSFARLCVSANYLTALDHLGVPEVWHRYRLPELQRVTGVLATDICAVGRPDRARLAAFCLMALLINHDHRATAKLSLYENNDLWMSIREGVLIVKTKRSRRKKHRSNKTNATVEADQSGRVYIVLPQCLLAYLRCQLALVPDADSFGTLLGIEDGDAWARRCEAYLAPLGDAAHPALPGRVSHSLGLAYLELGASPELAAVLGVAPCLCADSTLDYMCFEFCDARQMSAHMYDVLGLGSVAETREFGRMGSKRALTDAEVRSVWAKLDEAYCVALAAIERATDISAVARAYTSGSASGYLASTWTVGGRGQRTDSPTHTDLRAHARFVFWDDKDTKPTGERLVSRLPLLNTVVAAQLTLSAAAVKALERLGIPPSDIPTALYQPKRSDPVFGQLKTNAQGTGVEWSRLSGEEIALAVAACGCKHRNAARHTSASAVHSAGPGLWAVRTLLGHGRGAATTGSLLSTWAPAELLFDLGRRMEQLVERWELRAFGGHDSATEPLLLPVAIDLQRFDCEKPSKPRRGRPALYRHFVRHYCARTSLHALRAVDETRAELHTVGEFGRSGAVLISLVMMDGVLDPADLRSVWEVLRACPNEPNTVLAWTRETGQTIRMPMHPATQSWLELARRPEPKKAELETEDGSAPLSESLQAEAEEVQKLPSLDAAASAIAVRMREKFPHSTWPTTLRGTLEALSWLMCHWVRVHVPALLLYCYDAYTKAATYTDSSYCRISEPFHPSQISQELLKRAVAPRSPRRSLDAELVLLRQTVGGVAHDDRDIGDDLARSQQIEALLDERFDRAECSAFALLLLEWIDLEFDRWQKRQPDPLQMSPLAEYLRLIVRSVGTRVGELTPAQWTEEHWQRFAKFVLDVEKPEEEGQVGVTRAPGEIAERRQAWNRLVKVLSQADRYPEAASAFRARGVKAEPTHVSRSASSTYCSSEHLFAAEMVLRQLFANDPLEADLLVLEMRAGYECMGRADECNAVRLKDIGGGCLSLFGEFFSTEKTDGSRRRVPVSAEFTLLLDRVVAQLRTLRPPPSHLFSDRDGSVGLRYGRARQELIVLVMRAVLCDPEFTWHTFRGIGLMRMLAPGTEAAMRAFLSGDLGLEHARVIMAALRGADPRHLGRVFGCSGHASQASPGQSYLPAWPIWYAAAMRAAGEHPTINHRLLLELSGAKYAATHRKRRERSDEMDEWSMVANRGDRRACRHAPAAALDTKSALAATALPHWLYELARRDSVAWNTRLRFGIEVLFGLTDSPRAWRARIDGQTANGVIAALQPIPPLSDLHHPTPHRPNDKPRQLFTAADLLADDRAQKLLEALETASPHAVAALDELLSDKLRSFEPEFVARALSAIPATWKLELCWPRHELEMSLIARLAPFGKRLEGLQRRVHVRGGIRARVVPPVGANHTVNTSMTTLARAACRVWLRICN
jgi:hypothetical protein